MTTKTDVAELRNSEMHLALLAWKNGDITMVELKKVIDLQLSNQAKELLGRFEAMIGEDMTMQAAKKSHSDAGAGYTIGVNSFKKDLHHKLSEVKRDYENR